MFWSSNDDGDNCDGGGGHIDTNRHITTVQIKMLWRGAVMLALMIEVRSGLRLLEVRYLR